jgi:hypothetical protein
MGAQTRRTWLRGFVEKISSQVILSQVTWLDIFSTKPLKIVVILIVKVF